MRKLKTTWTTDSQQDMRSFINSDARQQLTDLLAAEITSEIDKEILADLRTAAGTTWKASHPAPSPLHPAPSVRDEEIKIPVKKYRSIDDPWENEPQ